MPMFSRYTVTQTGVRGFDFILTQQNKTNIYIIFIRRVSADNARFRAGSSIRERGGTLHPAAEIVQNALYDYWTIDFDIAVVRVSNFFFLSLNLKVARGGAVGSGTALKTGKVAGSIPNGVIGIFYLHNPSGPTMVLGLTQTPTEMSTRNISLG